MTTKPKTVKLSPAQMEIVRTIALADSIKEVSKSHVAFDRKFYDYYIENHFTQRQKAIIGRFDDECKAIFSRFAKEMKPEVKH